MNLQSTAFIVTTLFVFCGCKKSLQDSPMPAEPCRFASEQYTAVTEQGRTQSSVTMQYNADGTVSNSQQTQSDTSTLLVDLLGETSFSTRNISTDYECNDGFVTKKTEISTDFAKYAAPALGSRTSMIQSVTTYQYDSENRLTQQEKKAKETGGGSNNSLTTYTYDAQKNLLSQTTVSTSGTSTSTTKEIFGYSNGALSGYSFLSPNFNTPYSDYKFDANGWIVEIGTDSKPLRKFTYDTKGNKIKEEWYNLGTLLSVYTFDYDNAPVPRSLMAPFKGHPLTTLYRSSTNNSVREVLLKPNPQNSAGNLVESYDVNYKPTYNASGLLTSRFWKNPANDSFFYQYTYTYTGCN